MKNEILEISQIRKTNKNLKLIRSLDKICFPDDELLLFGLPKYHWFLTKINNNLAAYGIGYKTGKYYVFARCGVIPSFRGMGLQRKLIETRIEKAKSLQLSYIITYTLNDNSFSINNLQKYNFKINDNPPKRLYHKGFVHWILKLSEVGC